MTETKLVLFDIDGTLIDAGRAGTRALNKAVEEICGAPNVCEKFSLQGSTDKVNFSKAFEIGSGRKAKSSDVKKVADKYLEYLPGELEISLRRKKYRKIKGVEKFIKILARKKGVIMGLGTGNIREGAYLKLKESGLGGFFSFGGFGGDSPKRTVLLRKAVRRAEKKFKTRISPSEVYVIGDTHKDVAAAKEAGYHSAAVLDGFGYFDEIIRSSPELIAKDFSDTDVWLVWLGLKKDPGGIKRGTYICPDTPIEHAYHGMRGIDPASFAAKMKKLKRIKRGP